MKIAVILLNYKDYAVKYLPDCISSLRKVDFPTGEFTVFIVDNETSAETQAYIKQTAPEAELILNKENVGFGAGNNSGIAAAKEQGYDYYFLLNMDTTVDPDFLTEALAVYQTQQHVGIVQSRLMLYNEPTKINSIGNSLHFLGFGFCAGYRDEYTQALKVQEVTYPSGAALLISREVWAEIGGFTSEFFMYHDDVELGLKARLANYLCFLAPQSVVYHKYEFSRSIKKYYWMERNRILLSLMVFKWATLLVLFPAWLLMEAGMFIFAVKGGWWREKLKAYRWFFHAKNVKFVLKKRKQTQVLRKIPDRVLIRDFVGRIDYQETEMQNMLLKKIANPLFAIYWFFAKIIIRW